MAPLVPNIYLFSPALVLAVAFAISFTIEPRRLINGWLFTFFVVALLIAMAFAILGSHNRLLIAVSATLFIIFVLIVAAIFALHLVWLVWNAIVVWRRESHSLGNMLTLLIAVGLLLLEIGASFGHNFMPAWLYDGLAVFFAWTIGYVLITLYNYLVTLILYNLRRPHRPQDYLIVLGAGLLHGDQVSPLLAARIEAGIRYYQRQFNKTGNHPTMIFSGGQGADEKIPEAVAMRQYAIDQGVAADDTLIEDRSTTTFENMQFSSALIHQREKERKVHTAFFTNNYHLFRAGVYARLAGLNANGVGAPTSFYFLPNAVIREYLAMILLNKRRHLIVFGLIVLVSVATAITRAIAG